MLPGLSGSQTGVSVGVTWPQKSPGRLGAPEFTQTLCTPPSKSRKVVRIRGGGGGRNLGSAALVTSRGSQRPVAGTAQDSESRWQVGSVVSHGRAQGPAHTRFPRRLPHLPPQLHPRMSRAVTQQADRLLIINHIPKSGCLCPDTELAEKGPALQKPAPAPERASWSCDIRLQIWVTSLGIREESREANEFSGHLYLVSQNKPKQNRTKLK